MKRSTSALRRNGDMATFFGEVLSVYSRAVEEDEEDLDENEEDREIRRVLEEKREVCLQWNAELSESLSSGDKLQCSEFILAVGHNATRFVSKFVVFSDNWDVVGHASLWNERNQVIAGQSRAESSCVFYRQKDNPSVLVCQANCYIAEDQLFQWTEKVFACIQPRGLSVTVLSDSSVADYQTSDYLCSSSAPFLRSLQTSAFIGQPVCPSLEQPNIVTGLSAAVLNHCQVHHISTVVYQCYSDVIGPDSVTMETYKSAFTKLGETIKLSPHADVYKFIPTTDVQSNLYI